MSITLESRNEVIRNNNTAQEKLAEIMESHPNQSTTLHITETLHGDLDLLLLNDFNIQTITFSNGEITSVVNIPKSVSTFTCNANLLVSLTNLPSSLITLNVTDNLINDINVSNLKRLENLNISHNRLQKLTDLPSSLTTLLCDYNQLQDIDLLSLNKLTSLNISNNNITLVENMPDKIQSFVYENNPSIEFRNSDTSILSSINTDSNEKTNTNYTDALNEYFRLKRNYEDESHKKRKLIFEKEPSKKIAKRLVSGFIPKCIKCKRKVGTVFSRKETTYTAVCGDTKNPCDLDIQIYPGVMTQFQYIFDTAKEEFDKVKDVIIRQKLDTLFNFVTEEESVELFKNQLQLYNEAHTFYNDYLDKYNDMYNNKDTASTIQSKHENLFSLIEKNKDLLSEYRQTNNVEFLKSAVDLQITDIMPEIRNIRMLKHEIMEINTVTPESHFGIQPPSTHTLFQYPVSLAKLDHVSGEEQRVISFTI